MRIHRLAVLVLCLSGCITTLNPGATAQGGPDGLYTKRATWAASMASTRCALDTWRKSEVERLKVESGPWHVSQPLPAKGIGEALAPESALDLQAAGPDGKPLWNAQPELKDRFVHVTTPKDSSCIYFYRTLTAAEAVSVELAFGASDPMKVWLDGEKVFVGGTSSEAAPNQIIIPVSLKKGENKLLVKFFNDRELGRFCFSLGRDVADDLWSKVAADFPTESAWMSKDYPNGRCSEWFNIAESMDADRAMMSRITSKLGDTAPNLSYFDKAKGDSEKDITRRLSLYVTARRAYAALNDLGRFNPAALKMAVEDFGKLNTSYAGKPYLDRLNVIESQMGEIKLLLSENTEAGVAKVAELTALQREIMLSNPLLDFDKLLLVKRGEGNLGLPQNWQGNCAISSKGYDNEIASLDYKQVAAQPVTVYKPQEGAFVGDVDLHGKADKMLFSMPGSHGRWQIWESASDGTNPRQVTLGEEADVDNYDACYLPNEQIMFASTRCFQGIPCVGGGNTVANLCRMNADGSAARMLCFDQDHNWCPTVLNNGQVMYSRWEYSDTAHYFTRILFRMNPDGTGQSEYYGSQSYWPNSIFYARPIPNDPTKFVAIITGHHGVARMGELIIFDPAKSRHEADGVIQRIPGYGKKVEPVIADTLVDKVWPKFLHPYPLNDKYFLVSCKPDPDAQWGLYLVDVFDNALLLAQQNGYALFEPLPLRKTAPAPVIPDKVKLDKKDATVYLADIYAGGGLKGVPRGTVKNLRVYTFHYAYPQMGGHINIGVEGPWDARKILGTVPVAEDGSALFKVPANTPIAIQPLDEKGRAMQIMRSWFTAMPGETLSCVGCHERQNMAAPSAVNYASKKTPSEIAQWRGPARPYSFLNEVQPALDQYCVGCHDGTEPEGAPKKPDFSRKDKKGMGGFPPSYLALHPYVRRPGPESDIHMQKPLEFHASTSELVQMLEKGHHGVKMDDAAFDRICTWIDLNVPALGIWQEDKPIPCEFNKRRQDMMCKYANRTDDPESVPELETKKVEFVKPAEAPKPSEQAPVVAGWPFSTDEAVKRQAASGQEVTRLVDLGNGVKMEFVLVPAGEYVMGGDENADEWPKTPVKIEKPFWMAKTEISNRQYSVFDPEHRSGYQDQQHKDHTTPGYSAEGPDDPVIRVSWTEAKAFSEWLAAKAGGACSLPTEAQWEWACRAGSDKQFSYGDYSADFSAFANLADLSIKLLAVDGINPQPVEHPTKFQDFVPKDDRFDDGSRISCKAGNYQPNAWGLQDMHGNVAEWTLSAYKQYPYQADGRDDGNAEGKKVARGGSWRDRPKRATASYRQAYESWQAVYNVGFRVVIPVQ